MSGGFCETNPLSVFVCNGKKRGPTSVLQLQSSSLASGFAERVPDLHHALLGSLFGHPDMVPPEPAACLSGKVRSPVDPTEGDRDDWRSGRSSPSWPFSYGIPYPGQSAQHRKRIDDSLPRTKAARHSVCAKRLSYVGGAQKSGWLLGYGAGAHGQRWTSTSGEPPR